MFSRFLKVAIATSNFMNEVYNGGFSREFSISMLKEIKALMLEALSFKILSWISATTFAQFIQFGQIQNLGSPELYTYIYISITIYLYIYLYLYFYIYMSIYIYI